MSSQFEKDFPDMTDFLNFGKGTELNGVMLYGMYWGEEDIQEFCISKTKVKEAIEKFSGRSNNRWTDKAIQDFLKMELGLDGEQK
jgi:hypothetical protein